MIRLRQYIAGATMAVAALFAAGQIDVHGLKASHTPVGLILAVVAVAVGVIAVPRMARVSPTILSGIVILLYLVAKAWVTDVPSDIATSYTMVTAIEAILAAAATLCAQQIARCTNEFEEAVANITIGETTRVKPIETVSEDIAIEMSRARRHERPLTVTVLTVEPDVAEGSLHRIVQAVQRSMLERYVLSGVARLAAQKTRRGDIVVQDQANNRVIILSPEATPKQIDALAARLRSTAYRSLGLPIRYGCAGFPQNALTFDDLVEQAAARAGQTPNTGGDASHASRSIDDDREDDLELRESTFEQTVTGDFD